MSTLSVNNLQGLSPTNKVTVPAGHKLSCESGRYRLPNYAQGSRPSNAETGELIINTTTATLEMWTGDRWAICGGGNRGATQSNPAESAHKLSASPSLLISNGAPGLLSPIPM